MARLWFVAVLALVAACVPVGPPGAALAFIEVSSGGAFSGSDLIRVYADDRIEVQVSGPFGKDAGTRTSQGRPGVFDAVRAAFLAEGPGVVGRQQPSDGACPDYGSDAVRAEPPIDGFAGVLAQCPDPAVQAFQRRIRDVIAGR
jgi:hypothetical protein